MTVHQGYSQWRKSSYSGEQTNCVEFRTTPNGEVEVRNSNRIEAGSLKFTPSEWRAFIAGAKDGEFDI